MNIIEKLLEKEKMIWFEVERKNAKEFLKILKSLNFKWISGKIINPNKDKPFFHLSIDRDKTLSNVAIFAWFSPQTKHIKKMNFEEFLKLI